ncbi:MAG: hypothetical protein HY291_10480 [Planctomycetes bacterium]|nr:hypothetical protein [Planctomycetota bacterium]
MTKLGLFGVVGCCALLSLGAAETQKVPETAAGKTLNGVFFSDAKTGFIVGDQGLCLATADGGTTWEKRETGSGAILRDVRFKDAQHGWACGDNDPAAPECRSGHVMMGPGIKNTMGTILSTEDGGKTWKNNWVASAFELPSIEVSTAPALQLGVGGAHGHIDGDILRSNDGGKTWGGDRSFRGLFDIRALDEKHWIAVGAPVMVGFFPAPQSPLYLEKNCRVLFSKDGGKTWAPAKGSDGRTILRGAAVRTGSPCIAVGDKGSLAVSEDQGETWKAVDGGTQENLSAVAYSGDGKAAVAVGSKGTALLSADGGKTWKPLESGSTAVLKDVCAVGDGFVTVGASGAVLHFDAKALSPASAPAPAK